jgi:endo-1,4-beta-xylanase
MKKRLSTTRTLILSVGIIWLATAMILLSSFGGTGSQYVAGIQDSSKGLKDYYKDYFPIGVAVTPNNLEGEQGELIKKNFNSLTAENVMKPALIHPEENRYNWEPADKIVAFAQANGMKVRGHTLCWHSQTGAWMTKDAQGNQISKEVAFARLKEHVTAVVSHFKGKVYAWDVLNEIISDDSSKTKIYRETAPWYQICGDEFIPKIFQWAHEADPDAVLFYNDYNTENPVKRDKIFNFLKELIAKGVPVQGVGLQGHWNISDPSEKNLRESIDKFSSLGLKVQITELDVSIYASRTDTLNTGFTPEREQKQTDLYNMAFKVFREKKNVITGVTFWNISDRGSWLDGRPPRGKKYPLLFDENLKPKKAFWEVVKF